MNLDWDIVKKMRALYLEGVEARQLDAEFGYTGSINVVRNRTWHDPAYQPPPPRKGGRANPLLAIDGEEKPLREWSRDPRCFVSFETLRKRVARGLEGPELLLKKSNAGRPRRS